MDRTNEAGDGERVLVVDDTSSVANLYATWLEASYDVETAADGWEALESLDESVAVVVLDRRMPGPSGDDVLSVVRERYPDCHVAMVTAVEPDFDLVDMRCDDYLVKPVTREQLRETVADLFDRRAHDERLRELFALASKRSALERGKSQAQLDESEEYAALCEHIADLRETLDVPAARDAESVLVDAFFE